MLLLSMMNIKNNNSGKTLVFIILIIFIAALIVLSTMVNNLVNKQVDEDERKLPVQKQVAQKVVPKVKPSGEISRKTYLDPNRQFSVNIVYSGQEEIARYKSNADGNFDLVGEVPNGKIKFKNTTTKTYGSEEWKNNKRNGWLREYYDNGQLKLEAYYSRGVLKRFNEYFYDGVIRKEVDYKDAVRFVKSDEVGVGKMYGRKGNLMYEWSLTYEGQGGFNRTYGPSGAVLVENIFDESGNIIETNNFMEK